MRLLIAVASRHGSTHGIAEAIADELRAASVEVVLENIAGVTSLEGFDAVIIGSAVYMGNWMPEARRFVELHESSLTRVPVWVFSSGPVEADIEGTEPPKVAELAERLAARDHTVFAGKLDRSDLSLGERLVTRVVKAPEGDFRDWATIRAWARDVATELVAVSP
jgi:menaquinone-dependent protoporphyrinogen oxidase